MEKQLRVVALVGSLRRESYTRRVVNALTELAPETMAIEIAPVGALPLYDEDEETDVPSPAWQALRNHVRRSDAVLFATPEYNRSIPGGRKKTIDGRRCRTDHDEQDGSVSGGFLERFREVDATVPAWAEAVTRLGERGVRDNAFEAAAAVFAEKQIVDLTLAIGVMNAYNRMEISFRATPIALAN